MRVAVAEDAAEVAAILAAGFHDDPVLSWVFAAEQRMEKLLTFFSFLAREALVPLGAAYLVDRAVACWTPPAPPPWPGERGERFGATLRQSCPADDLERLRLLDEAMQAHHPSEPHWYLGLIAAHPQAQGRGLGSALLSHTLRERVDGDGLPAYLEATSQRNAMLYERHGFRVVGVTEPPGDRKSVV